MTGGQLLLYRFGFAAIATLALLLVHELVHRWMSAKRTHPHPPIGRPAESILYLGQMLGIFIVSGNLVAGVVKGDSVRSDAMWFAIFGAVAAVLLVGTGELGVRLLLRSKLTAEVQRGNVAAGVAASGHYVATALIVGAAVGGEGLGMIGVSLTFFVLAIVTLQVFVVLFRTLTSYDDSEEILAENLAAAISYAGVTIGMGIIIGQAVEGTFTGWVPSLKGYAKALVYCGTLYFVRQLVVQTLIVRGPLRLRGGKLDELVGRKSDVGVAAIEAGAYIGAAILLGHVRDF